MGGPSLNASALTPNQATEARQAALADLYVFAKSVLGFDRLVHPLHREMCDRAQAMTDPSRNMILYPRGHFKSTIFSIAYPLWMLCRDPNLRILLVGAKSDNAEHFLGKIKRTIEQNATFRVLFPDRCPPDTTKTVWTQKEILFPRQRDYPEYSIETAGVGASVTSRHYDIIIKDDLINEDTYLSPTEMLRVIDWHLFSNSLFMDDQSGIDVVVGTLWPSTNDIYTHIRTKEPEYRIKKRSAVEQDQSIFPERFPVKALLALRDKDPVKFACQYQNEPHTSGVMEFRDEWLQFYEYEKRESVALVRLPNGQVIPIGKMNRTLRVDPALTALADMRPGSKPSRSAIVVDGVAPDGNVFVLEAWAGFVDPRDLLSKVFEVDKRWRPTAWGIERVAYQKVLKYWMEERAAQLGRRARITELVPDTKTSKEARIRTAICESFGEQKVYVRRDMVEFLEEYRNFPQTGATVDLLDAFAYGPQMWRAPIDDEAEPVDDGIPTVEALCSGRSPITGY